MLDYIAMSDDDLFRSGHRPSIFEQYEFKSYDPSIEQKPLFLDPTDPDWYPGHPLSLYRDTRFDDEERSPRPIQPIVPTLPIDEHRESIDPNNPTSLIAGGLIVALVAYIFWAL
ncbi:hypothetical protein LH19_26185 (plasmid) [Sphingopyxis macrogoltabida]|nr:hypothetical protein LH19_26185 [Sphingopyxis macrogoltabida]